jgi:hypothetical protein
MRTIYYSLKLTAASTNYMTIERADLDYLTTVIIGIQSLMNELSLCPVKDVKYLVKWYTKPSDTLPRHGKWRKHNSPASFIAGTLNNTMYGTQNDLTEIQSQHLQNIINTFVGIAEALRDLKIDVQKHSALDTILFSENVIQFVD